MSDRSDLLKTGIEALQNQRPEDAVQALEAFCQTQALPYSKPYIQAQMWLVRAYQENGQLKAAIALCQQMSASQTLQVRSWAEGVLPRLQAEDLGSSQGAGSARAVAPEPDPVTPRLSVEAASELLSQGNQALKVRRFAAAVEALATYCQGTDPATSDYAQAQMWLVKAYKGNEQLEAAIALCEQLLTHEKEYVRTWATQYYQTLVSDADLPPEPSSPSSVEPSTPKRDTSNSSRTSNSPPPDAPTPPPEIPKAGRSLRSGVKLSMRGVTANLTLASGVTLALLFGMVWVLCLSFWLIKGSRNPTQGLLMATAMTIAINALMFFIAPLWMDLIQGWLYGTRWTALSEIQRHSPETARVMMEVCQNHKIAEPRLGIIEDDNPTAFTYGSLPNTARLVVSRGLFQYLDDDEIAAVYAHELGHIVHWDFAVMTLAQTLVQICYLLYTYIEELAQQIADRAGGDIGAQVKNGAKVTATMAYVFYLIGEYLVLYLSRTREYYADHFAAEVTGNPNGLSRALVKIAYGILAEGQRSETTSKVLQGTRAMGIADHKSAAMIGTAYRVAAQPEKVGRVFLWDMFNPWAWWMELNSTHPLTGKRVRALSTYAEQLGLDSEFNMAHVVREGRHLNKKKLYGNFVTDLILMWAEAIGFGLGLLVGIAILTSTHGNWRPIVSLPLIGLGIGSLAKVLIAYPDFHRVPETDVLTLMSDPYASPLRGRPVKLQGTVVGRGNAGYIFGSDLKMQDPTGLIYLRYASRFGPLGNFLFGMTQADSFIHKDVRITGWFRRGIMPWVDFTRMDCDSKWTVTSYHRFWLLVQGVGAIVLAFMLPNLLAALG